MKRVLILLLCLTLPTAWAEPTSAVIVKALNAEKEWDSDLEKCPADLLVPADRHITVRCGAGNPVSAFLQVGRCIGMYQPGRRNDEDSAIDGRSEELPGALVRANLRGERRMGMRNVRPDFEPRQERSTQQQASLGYV
jgi:hypothetical protein